MVLNKTQINLSVFILCIEKKNILINIKFSKHVHDVQTILVSHIAIFIIQV